MRGKLPVNPSHGVIPAELTGDERLAQRIAWQLAASRAIEPELYAEARQAIYPKMLVGLTALAGIYGFVCGLLNGAAIPAPPSGA